MLDHSAFSMQQCKCLDVQRSGERTSSGPRRAQQEAVPTGPTKGATGKIKEFCLAGIEPYDKRKGNLPLYKLTRGGIPQKGLTAQWLQQFVSLYRGKLPAFLCF